MKTNYEFHPSKLKTNLAEVWKMLAQDSRQSIIQNILALPMVLLALLLAFVVVLSTFTDMVAMVLEFIYIKTKGNKQMLSLTIKSNERLFIKTPTKEFSLKYVKSKQTHRIHLFLSVVGITAPPFQVLALDEKDLGKSLELEIEGYKVLAMFTRNIPKAGHSEYMSSSIHLTAPWAVQFAREKIRTAEGFTWTRKGNK